MATTISHGLIVNLRFCGQKRISTSGFISYHSTNGMHLKNVHEKVMHQSPWMEWGQLGQVVRHLLWTDTIAFQVLTLTNLEKEFETFGHALFRIKFCSVSSRRAPQYCLYNITITEPERSRRKRGVKTWCNQSVRGVDFLWVKTCFQRTKLNWSLLGSSSCLY